MDRIVDCSEQGGCDIEEMMGMIDELEELNSACQNAMSRECNLDAVAARNVLKVALASRVATEDALSREEADCAMSPGGDEDENGDDPYASMADMDDGCHPDYVQRIPSATSGSGTAARLDRIVECVEGPAGECDVDEMLGMADELERLNMDCEGALSRECSLDAVAARNILKVALASKSIR